MFPALKRALASIPPAITAGCLLTMASTWSASPRAHFEPCPCAFTCAHSHPAPRTPTVDATTAVPASRCRHCREATAIRASSPPRPCPAAGRAGDAKSMINRKAYANPAAELQQPCTLRLVDGARDVGVGWGVWGGVFWGAPGGWGGGPPVHALHASSPVPCWRGRWDSSAVITTSSTRLPADRAGSNEGCRRTTGGGGGHWRRDGAQMAAGCRILGKKQHVRMPLARLANQDLSHGNKPATAVPCGPAYGTHALNSRTRCWKTAKALALEAAPPWAAAATPAAPSPPAPPPPMAAAGRANARCMNPLRPLAAAAAPPSAAVPSGLSPARARLAVLRGDVVPLDAASAPTPAPDWLPKPAALASSPVLPEADGARPVAADASLRPASARAASEACWPPAARKSRAAVFSWYRQSFSSSPSAGWWRTAWKHVGQHVGETWHGV